MHAQTMRIALTMAVINLMNGFALADIPVYSVQLDADAERRIQDMKDACEGRARGAARFQEIINKHPGDAARLGWQVNVDKIRAEAANCPQELAEERNKEITKARLRQEELDRSVLELQALAAAKAQAAAEHEAQLDTLRTDAKRMFAVNGAVLCTHAERRRRILAAIAREHRYAHETGSLNLRHLEGLKESLEMADDEAAPDLAEIKRHGAKCSSVDVMGLLACRDVQRCAKDWYRLAQGMLPAGPEDYQ